MKKNILLIAGIITSVVITVSAIILMVAPKDKDSNKEESQYNEFVEGKKEPEEVVGEVELHGINKLPKECKQELLTEIENWAEWERIVSVDETNMTELDFINEVYGEAYLEEVESKIEENGAPKNVYIVYGESEYDTLRYTAFIWEDDYLLLYTGP